MKSILLALPLLIATTAAPSDGNAQGVGFGSYSGSAGFASSNRPVAPVTPVAVNKGELKRAAERTFGLGRKRDEVTVMVGDRTMGMRIVVSKGFTFAVLSERGIPFSLRGQPNLSAQAQDTAQRTSGCAISGNTWTKRYSNGAFPKYAVHLICN